ncbi:glycerophosphodiester phosphodiesterase [Clostridioides difficile]
MINFAHRGASSDYPENTILAFSEAIRLGAGGIELDVHKSKDNKLVVIHDEDIERTFVGKGLVKDYTLEELKKFKNRKLLFKDNDECKIPTLEEVLKLFIDNTVFLNIELKTDIIEYKDIEKDVIDLIYKYNMRDRVILSSFNHNSIVKCKEIDDEILTGALYENQIEDVINYAKELKVDAIHPDLRLVSRELIEEAHKNNIKVNVYTVNNPIHMRMLIDAGVDGIFTDIFHLLNDIINK